MYITYPFLFAPEKFHVNALIFVGATLRKVTKNHHLAVFYSIKTYFPMTEKLEIWHMGFPSPFICPWIISCHSIDFCGSQAQKGTKNCNFAVFYCIKTNFLMSGKLEIWNVRFLPPLICSYKISCKCINYFTICTQITPKNGIFQHFTTFTQKNPNKIFCLLYGDILWGL